MVVIYPSFLVERLVLKWRFVLLKNSGGEVKKKRKGRFPSVKIFKIPTVLTEFSLGL